MSHPTGSAPAPLKDELARLVPAAGAPSSRERLLIEASRVLGGSLEYEATLQQVAQLAVPALADWCVVDVLDEATDTVRQVAMAHVDPERAAWADALRRRDPLLLDTPGGTASVARTGRAERYPEITDAMLAATARDAQHLALLRALGLRSLLVVPLVARGRSFGALTLVWAESGRRYGVADLVVAEELGRRAGLAVDNARLYAAEQTARRTAQEVAGRLSRLHALAAALTGARTSAEVNDVVMRQGVVALGAQAGVIALVVERGDDAPATEIELVASIGYPAAACMGVGRRWSLDTRIPITEAATTGEPVFVESPDAWARRYQGGYAPPRADASSATSLPVAPRGTSAAWAALPLGLEGRARGVLLWTYAAPRAFDAADHAHMQAIARLAGQALERARLYETERELRARAESAAARALALQEVASALVGARTAADVADAVLREGARAVRAHRGSVNLVTPDGATLEITASMGYPAEIVAQWSQVPLAADFPTTDAARLGEPIFLSSAGERDRRYPHLAALRRANGGGAMSAVPIASGDRVLGVIGLNFPDDHAFASEERAFLLTLARQCAHALDRVRLDEAEREARAAAEEANRAKSDFLAVMSHELRTPLNAIAGYVELMELGIRGPVTEEQRHDLARIRRSQRSLLSLINDVLNFAKIEAGRVEYTLCCVELAAVLAQLDDLVAPQLAAKGIAYRSEARPGPAGPLCAHTDADKLRQILLNLLSNAIKFTPAGGTVQVSAAASAGGVVEVRVRDSGGGIPADQLESIFEPFVQVRTGLTRPAEGTGLGLAISRDLARAMGGDLTVASELGVGSTFVVTLPADAGLHDTLAQAPVSAL